MANEENNVEATDTEDEIVEIPSDWAAIKPYRPTITFGDGSVIYGYAARTTVLSSDNVWVYPEETDLSYVDIVTMFTNSDKTTKITVTLTKNDLVTFEGYTRLTTINQEVDGKYAICLAK